MAVRVCSDLSILVVGCGVRCNGEGGFLILDTARMLADAMSTCRILSSARLFNHKRISQQECREVATGFGDDTSAETGPDRMTALDRKGNGQSHQGVPL